MPLTLLGPPNPARPDHTHPAFGAYTTKYRLKELAIPKRRYASVRIEVMKSEAALPVHAIFETNVIGVSKTLPDLNEIVRSVVAPTIVVNFFQSAFTSVSITPAIVAGLLNAVAAPFQVTATTSITRSSTA